jgi:hypothetical protein
MRITGKALAAVAALMLWGGAARADYVVNGGFETGDFTGWTAGGNFEFTSVQPSGVDGFAAQEGSFFALLGPVGALGSLSQTFADSAGEILRISFHLGSRGGTSNEFKAFFDGATLLDLTDIPDTGPGYTGYAFDVAATGTDTVEFDFRDDPAYLALDAVGVRSVTSVREPASLTLLGAALIAFGAVRRRGGPQRVRAGRTPAPGRRLRVPPLSRPT